MLALDDRGLHAELGGADRGDIAAGAGADDDEVEILFGHVTSPVTGPSGAARAVRRIEALQGPARLRGRAPMER